MLAALRKFLRGETPSILIFVGAILIYSASSYFDIFERFVEFSHLHENWELDKLLMLSILMTTALSASLTLHGLRLRREMARRAEAEQHANELARHDSMTGLVNRRHFVAELARRTEAAQASQTCLAAMLIDLDRFKPVNDLHGHAAGDEILVQVSERILQVTREEDTVARIGGDEFAVLASWDAKNPAPVARIANRIRAILARPFVLRGLEVEISASIGVATLSDSSAKDLMRNADQAMYRAKRSGRNKVAHFDEALSREIRRRSELEQEIRRGVRAGEFAPHFHPLIDLANGAVCGFEALARWSHPTRGLIGPTEFIPIAEEVGLIGDIGWMVLRKACAAAVTWREPLPISFNLSPSQFQDRGLAEKVCAVLEETGLPPERLEVEVTECGVIQDLALAESTIASLKARKVRVALDDFGTGYSSLTTLRRLPFDKLKIDRSFVTGAQADDENVRIVQGIVMLAQSLGLATTAEGVENESEADWLKSIGCVQGQGFFYARPMSAEETRWWLDSRVDEATAIAERPPLEASAAAS